MFHLQQNKNTVYNIVMEKQNEIVTLNYIKHFIKGAFMYTIKDHTGTHLHAVILHAHTVYCMCVQETCFANYACSCSYFRG